MRILLIAADIVMGLILGVFLYVVVSKTWVVLAHPIVAGVILAASVLIVMFRVPNGSLARRENRPGN